MKTINHRLLILFVSLFFAVVVSGCKSETPPFQVNDVVSDPGAFSGPMTIVGVVNAFAQADPSIVGIMDKKELQCTTPNCKKVLLAVKVSGKLPTIGDEVKVSGSFTTAPWGYVFNAETVEVLAQHKLGGQG